MNECPWELVAVWWTDAYDSENGWINVATYKPEPRTVVSVGYVWPDCLDGHLSITASFFPDELPHIKDVGMVTHIPNGMLKRIIPLVQPTFDVEPSLF